MKSRGLSVCLLQSQPDGRLVELAGAGHEPAFEALVQRHRRALLGYSRRLSSSDAGAEDAVQQALLQAWLALGKPGTEVRDARAWLHRIVHNVAVSNVRRPTGLLPEVDPANRDTGADSEFERRLAANEALAGLAALPDLQREVMLCTALEGRSHEEIAETFGLSQGAVRGLIYRARVTLRAAAAAWMPAPLVNWIARRPAAGGGRGLYEAMAGGGSAGLAGVLLKSGAVALSAGAIAASTGLPAGPGGGSAPPTRSPRAARATGRPAAAPAALPSASGVVARPGIVPGRAPRIGQERDRSEGGGRRGRGSGSGGEDSGGRGSPASRGGRSSDDVQKSSGSTPGGRSPGRGSPGGGSRGRGSPGGGSSGPGSSGSGSSGQGPSSGRVGASGRRGG